MMENGGKRWKMVGNGGKWWKIVENGKMMENGGKRSKSIEIPNAIKAKGESFETNPDTEQNWAKTCVDVFGLPILTRTKQGRKKGQSNPPEMPIDC